MTITAPRWTLLMRDWVIHPIDRLDSTGALIAFYPKSKGSAAFCAPLPEMSLQLVYSEIFF
jgi:hypothetical protein